MKIDTTEIIVLREKVDKISADAVVSVPGQFTDEEKVRRFTFDSLGEAQKKKNKIVVFSLLPEEPTGLGSGIVSKIMAQEVLRYVRTATPDFSKIIFVVSTEEMRLLFEKNMYGYLHHMTHTLSRGPYLTVDAIIEYGGGIVMVERSNPPLGWALPGGFVDYGESAEDAVCREVKEETHLDFENITQFKVYSQPSRDPRFHTVSVVFYGVARGEPTADSDAKGVGVFDLDELPSIIAFDHRQIIEDYRKLKMKDEK